MLLVKLLATFFAVFVLAGDPLLGGLAVVVGLGLVVALCHRAVRANLPVEPTLVAIDLEPTPATADATAALRALGFEQLAPGYELQTPLRPAAVPFVDRSRNLLAAVYQLQQPTQRTYCDIVSLGQGGAVLTTANAPDAGNLPPPAGGRLQILADRGPAELVTAHLAGLELLRGTTFRAARVAGFGADDFVRALTDCLRAQRVGRDAAPLRTTLVALWRTLSGRSPHRAPLAAQLAQGTAVNGSSARAAH